MAVPSLGEILFGPTLGLLGLDFTEEVVNPAKARITRVIPREG